MDIEYLLHLTRQVQIEWVIRLLVLTSMVVQLMLVVCGARRYISSSRSLRAPLLLLHLGSPDAITAYALADNELWLRYACTMVYQVSVAGYVMCICKQEGFVFAAGFLLLVAGVCKYVERTAALAFATYFEIVNSTEPIFKFMEHEDKIEPGEFNYIVVGEKQLNDWWENHLWPTSPREFPGVTTIQHVWSHEDRQPTDDYLLCLSYALFKLYKRQFVSLYFYEWSRNKTRRFFLRNGLECENVFRVVSYVLQRLLWRFINSAEF
ncbi:uncharacterized protein LOC131045678 [Cryptomeria japonica]|uniref:uncharacterized protein LOC131045678 n=1 Tax=Cryptomeria japonica TaxID=3369 RepID=UPI0027DA4135|nr:uncharacterized protein LOC131045678 [Cryptomeria japonica]